MGEGKLRLQLHWQGFTPKWVEMMVNERLIILYSFVLTYLQYSVIFKSLVISFAQQPLAHLLNLAN